MTERKLIAAVDPAASPGSGVAVFEISALPADAFKAPLVRDSTMPKGATFVVTDEFVDMLRGSAEGLSVSTPTPAEWAADIFGVPASILGIPYVVDRHLVDVKARVATPLKTGKRGTVRRVDWARTLRVNRALRRRARRRGVPAVTFLRDIRIHAVSVNADSMFNSGGPIHLSTASPNNLVP